MKSPFALKKTPHFGLAACIHFIRLSKGKARVENPHFWLVR